MPYIGNPIYQSAFVTDQFNGDGSTTAFTMSVAPAGVSNVLVAVSGVLQDPSTYGVAGNTITFSTAPPSGTGNISCRYLGVPVTGIVTTAYRTVTEFTATASQTTFTPPSYTVGFINVYLNGVLLGSADYTATNGTTVVLATGASAGNLVTVESFRVETVLNAISNSAGAINLAGTLISGTLPVANGGTGVTTSTGTSSVVRATSPTLTTPIVATTMGVGGATPAASGSGITFPAAQSASSDANTLDDYEEGTYTMSWTCGGGSITLNSTDTRANYTKIGRLVTVNAYAIVSSVSSPSGLLFISLPFTSSNINTGARASPWIAFNGLSAGGNNSTVWPIVDANVNSCAVYVGGGTGVSGNFAAYVTTNTDARITITYIAAN